MFNFTWFFVLKPWLTCMLSSSPLILPFLLSPLPCLPYSISDLLSRPLKLFDSSPFLFFHSLIFSHHLPSFCFHHSPPCLFFSLLSACFSSPIFFHLTPSVSFKLLFPHLSFCHPFLILCFFISPCLSSPTPTYFHLLCLASFVPYHPPSSLRSSCLFFNFFILYPFF